MLRKTIVAIATLTAALGCGSSGDGSNQDSQETATDSTALRVAVMPTIDCMPVFVAYHSGIFESESLNVALCRFTAHMDCDTAMAGGSVHVIPTDLVRAERLIDQGTPLQYITSTTPAWQLLTSKTARIKKLPQMDDKMLAMTRFSATAMMADNLVDSAKLAKERVFRIQVNDVLVRLNMMETGIMDAMLLPEPQATVARSIGCSMLYDSTADSLEMGALAVSEKTMADTLRRQQVEAFTRAYDKACDSINTYGLAHYADIIAGECHVTRDMADSIDKQRPMAFSHATKPRQAAIDKAKAWLKKVR